MPQFLAGLILPIITTLAAPLALGTATLSSISLGLGYGVLAAGAYAAQALLMPKPAVPKQEDGKYNIKQVVPSLVFALGLNDKGSDYLALEEKSGVVVDLLCVAGHRIDGFERHQLHDEVVTLDVDGDVEDPAHFAGKVNIQTRLGLDAETAYPYLPERFPEAFTEDHRGDGLATVLVRARSVSDTDLMEVFPQGKPSHRTRFRGALLFDPREVSHDPDDRNTWAYTTSLALFRLWHLTHPVGGKLSIADLYLPEWIVAAGVGDETVLNRSGDEEPRYHGGLWFRAENDPVEVGRLLDQAAEMVVYERPDGLIGVHAGRFVTPTIRLTQNSVVSFDFDANKRIETNVLAVRGRYTSELHGFNTVDAAIVGDPYVGEDTQRSRTLANQAVRRHNHIERLQRIKFIRDNAPRVTVRADYDAAEDVPFNRFIRVHYPPYCDEAIVELTSDPTTNLRDMTVEFSGIVIPATLYDFDAATDEGAPPTIPADVIHDGIPAPVNFDVTMQNEAVGGGARAAFGLATWDAQDEALLVEVEWEPTPAGLLDRVYTTAGETSKRTAYLGDGKEYRFRARNWSAGAPSEWTAYVTRTAVADSVGPDAMTDVAVSGNLLGGYTLGFKTPNSGNLKEIKRYRVPVGSTLNRVMHLVETYPVLQNMAYTRPNGDLTRVNLYADPTFVTGAGWTYASGWAFNVNKATKTANAVANMVAQSISLVNGASYRTAMTTSARTAGTVQQRLGAVLGALRNTNGTFYETLVAGAAGAQNCGAHGNSAFAGSVDDMVLYEQTVDCIAQGNYTDQIEAVNHSGVPGPLFVTPAYIII